MTGSAKQKGMRGEYEVRDILQTATDEVCGALGMAKLMIERNVDQVRSSLGNQKGSDLTGLPWFAVEVKYQENDSAWNKWWDQCKSAAWVFDENGAEVGANGRRGYFAREPVLFSRKNHASWEVRLFAYLLIENGMRIRLPVDTTLPNFLLYFKNRLKYELMKKELERERKVELGPSLDTRSVHSAPIERTLLGISAPSPGDNLPNLLSTGEIRPTPIGEILPNLNQFTPISVDYESKEAKFDGKTGELLEGGVEALKQAYIDNPPSIVIKKPWDP